MQAKDDEKYDILPVAGRVVTQSDHARMPVMMPRGSDGKMRRDAQRSNLMQPHHPVDKRERLHGALELGPKAEQRIVEKRRDEFSNAKGKPRCRKSRLTEARLRWQDKSRKVLGGRTDRKQGTTMFMAKVQLPPLPCCMRQLAGKITN